MNENEISPKTDSRLNRIKLVSRIVRYVVLANLVFNVCFFFVGRHGFYLGLHEISMRSYLNILLLGLASFWFWELASLFRLYERGLFFGAEAIRCIKILGIVCLCGWLTMVALHFAPYPVMQFPNVQPGTQVVIVQRDALFSFNFGTGVDFGPLLVGASVVVAAWIMGEARKIQEEQELTV